MKKKISLLLVFVLALSMVAMFSACSESSSGSGNGSKTLSERAQHYAESYAEGYVIATYGVTTIPYVRASVREVSGSKFIVTGNMTIVQDGGGYNGTFVIELSYSASSDDFEVEDSEFSNFYRG